MRIALLALLVVVTGAFAYPPIPKPKPKKMDLTGTVALKAAVPCCPGGAGRGSDRTYNEPSRACEVVRWSESGGARWWQRVNSPLANKAGANPGVAQGLGRDEPSTHVS